MPDDVDASSKPPLLPSSRRPPKNRNGKVESAKYVPIYISRPRSDYSCMLNPKLAVNFLKIESVIRREYSRMRFDIRVVVGCNERAKVRLIQQPRRYTGKHLHCLLPTLRIFRWLVVSSFLAVLFVQNIS